jgi:ABC-type multidrug transport system fused ATPase/permease subunit
VPRLAKYPLLRCLALYRLTPRRFLATLSLYATVNLGLAWQQRLVGRAVHDVERGVAVVRTVTGALDTHVAWRWVWILGVVALARAALQYGTGLLGLVIQQELLSTLREKILAQVQRLDLAYHWRHGAGEIITRTTRDADKLRDALTSFWRQVVDSVFVVAAAMALLFWYHPLLGVVPLVLTVAGLAALIRQADALVVLDRLVGTAYDEVNQDLTEGIHGVRVIKAFSLEGERVRRFEAQVRVFVGRALDALRYASVGLPGPQMVVAFGQVWVLGFGIHLVTRGRLNRGELVAALLMVNTLVFRIESIGRVIKVFADARASAARIWELLDAEVSIRGGETALPEGPLGVRLENVVVRAPGGGNAVLEGLSLSIAPGEVVALVGATGSGKSTLASLFPRLVDPDAGRILVGSDPGGWRDLRALDAAALRRRIHAMPQESFLFSDTLAANLRLGAPHASNDELAWALHMASAADVLAGLPDGLETRVGDRGVTLSGGQRQRICLARALLAQPAVLVLDDATSALDAVTERRILDNLRALGRDRGHATTVVLIAGKLSTILLANRVALLAGGRIAAVGSHAELAATSPSYRELLGLEGEGEIDLTALLPRSVAGGILRGH